MKALKYSLVCLILATCAGCQKSAQERYYDQVERDAQKAQDNKAKAAEAQKLFEEQEKNFNPRQAAERDKAAQKARSAQAKDDTQKF
jgi:Tfp pilus assembly protein PilP